MAKVIELVRARYEVQDVEFGKVYRWYSEWVIVERDWGKRVKLHPGRKAVCTAIVGDETNLRWP